VDFVAKPENSLDIRITMAEIIAKIKQAAKARIKKQAVPLQAGNAALKPSSSGNKSLRPYSRQTPVILIGSSTGGPGALSEIIPALPSDLPSPVVIVQHMPAGFTRSLSERLNSISALHVKEAEPGDALMVGQILVAPGGFHMTLDDEQRVTLNQKPAVHGVRPAVDVTLNSLNKHFGRNMIGVILTGMGSDGTLGMSILHSAGGYVIAEDESAYLCLGYVSHFRDCPDLEAAGWRERLPLEQLLFLDQWGETGDDATASLRDQLQRDQRDAAALKGFPTATG